MFVVCVKEMSTSTRNSEYTQVRKLVVLILN